MYKKAGDEKGSISVWNEKGSLLFRTGRLNEAATCFDSLILLARKYSDFPSWHGIEEKSRSADATGNHGMEELYLGSLEAAEKTGNREVLQPSVFALAGYYEQNNNYRKALSLYRRYMDLHDSIYAEKEKQQILFSQINFEIKLRDEQLKKVTQRLESL
jgi:tetratricopeptide (TPR) repeat protein